MPHSKDWITKEQAAKLLAVAVRQVQKRAEQGYIRKQYAPKMAHERTARVEYSREDIEALKNGAPNLNGVPMTAEEWEAQSQPAPRPKSGDLVRIMTQQITPPEQLAVVHAQADVWKGVAEHLARLSQAYPPAAAPVTKAWLTLEEAAEYSGLDEPAIAGLVRGEIVHSIGRGPKTWRIQRASLDAYGQAAHQ